MRLDSQRIRMWIVALMSENASFVAEINEHRAARGYAPLTTHEVQR